MCVCVAAVAVLQFSKESPLDLIIFLYYTKYNIEFTFGLSLLVFITATLQRCNGFIFFEKSCQKILDRNVNVVPLQRI